MFKRIISQLSLSPATVERLSTYARTTRERQRLMGWAAVLLWVLTTLGVLAVLFPPLPSTSATANDLIPGGISSKEGMLSAYEHNIDGFQTAAGLFSIEADELMAASECEVPAASRYITGRTSYLGESQEHAYQFTDRSVLYLRAPSHLAGFSGWCGTGPQGKFAVSAIDGNILTTQLPSRPSLSSSLTRSHSLVQTGASGDSRALAWELELTNSTDMPIVEDIYFSTGDISEYASISSVSHEGIFTAAQEHVVWPNTMLLPSEKATLTVTAQLDQPIDETSFQPHNPYAYDCRLTTSFGTSLNTDINCPLTKQAEVTLHTLPTSSTARNLSLYVTFSLIATALYVFLRLQTKEIRIIRTHLNSGGLL